jgi:hypothetical protein
MFSYAPLGPAYLWPLLRMDRHYDNGGVIHSGSDGQKFETAVRTFMCFSSAL